MIAYDQNLQLDSQYTYDTYFSASVTFVQPIVEGAVAITTINGITGPSINFEGGTTGYNFVPSGSNIVMIGAANSIRETSGPQILDFGAIAPNDFLRRQGNTIVGDPSPASAPLGEVTTAVDLTLSDSNDVVFVDTSGGPVTITLHDPTTAKQKYYDIKLVIAGNNLTIDGSGANIDGSPTLVTSTQYTAYTLIPDNDTGEWFIV